MGEGAETWDRLVPLLRAAGHRVGLLDRPGPADGRAPTLTDEVARIDAGVAGLGRPVLVAHSAAALPAEAYARRHPGRLAGLVLVDPSLVDPSLVDPSLVDPAGPGRSVGCAGRRGRRGRRVR